MDFETYVRKILDKGVVAALKPVIPRFARKTRKDLSLIELHDKHWEVLGGISLEHLSVLVAAHKRWRSWRQALERHQRKQALPKAVLEETTEPHQLGAIARAQELVPRTSETEAQWHTRLKSAVAIWNASLAVARREGEVVCHPGDPSAKRPPDYDEHAGQRQPIKEISPYRWMAWRRGEKNKAFRVGFTLPNERMQEIVQRRRDQIGAAVAELTDGQLLDRLVTCALPTVLKGLVDREMEDRAIATACGHYRDLLLGEPVLVRRVGACFMAHEHGMVGAVVVDERGGADNSRAFDPGESLIDEVVGFFSESKVDAVALPTGAVADPRLGHLARVVNEKFTVVRVRPAGIALARQQILDGPNPPAKEIASALVIGRRAVQPVVEWARIDPVALGLAEYQSQLDISRLRQSLLDVRAQVSFERTAKPVPGKSGEGAGIVRSKLNTAVNSVDDLKAGMNLRGVVTDVADFGIFLELGLPYIGMIHVSELSERHGRDLLESMTIGRELPARVMTVDSVRGRIALTMKKGGGGKPTGKRRSPARAAALAELEKLFKK